MSAEATVQTTVTPPSHGRLESPFEELIASRICVEWPYNQLTNLSPWADGVEAEVQFESQPGVEIDPLASAEVGRHLAILGSCALARNNAVERKHYYLATRALLVRFPERGLSREHRLSVRARPQGADAADVELLQGGKVCATLSCKYIVLSDRAFARLFKAHRLDTTSVPVASPYAVPTQVGRLTTSPDFAAALLEAVTPEMCPGHWTHYPAMPVAVLMDGIHRLACQHARETTHPHIRLVTCGVGADRLAFAGESVEFSVRQIARDRDLLRYEGFARRLGEPDTVFGRAELAYQLLESPVIPGPSDARPQAVASHLAHAKRTWDAVAQ